MAGGKWSKAGGGGDESLSSTELLTAGSAAWVEAAPLPSARNGLRAVTVPLSDYYGADRVIVTGTETLPQVSEVSWNPLQAAQLMTARLGHTSSRGWTLCWSLTKAAMSGARWGCCSWPGGRTLPASSESRISRTIAHNIVKWILQILFLHIEV